MKKAIGVFIALFTLLSNITVAQQIFIDINSASGDIGDVVSIPVNVLLPPGSQTFDGCKGKFVIGDPSIAEIVSVTAIPFVVPNISQPGQVNFTTMFGATLALNNGVLMTLDVKILDYGCTDVSPADIDINTPFEFVVNNTSYADLNTDFVATSGKVCGDCPLFIENVRVFPSTQSTVATFVNPSENSISNYEDFTSNCIPFNPQPLMFVNGSQDNFYLAIYIDNDANPDFETLAFSTLVTTGGITWTPTPVMISNGSTIRIIMSDHPITGPDNIPACGEVEDYQLCEDCDCDLNNLTLGQLTLVPSNDCSTYGINVPEVVGCALVESSHSYYFQIFNSSGIMVFDDLSTANGTSYDFQTAGTYSIEVTYTITDLGDCVQSMHTSIEFVFDGCPCAHVPAPENPSCSFISDPKTGTTKTLSWDAVSNADYYEIKIVTNDPKCCGSLGLVRTKIQVWPNTAYSFSNTRCFSWSVRAVCADGTKSEWSEDVCTCGPIGSGGPGLSLKKAVSPDETNENSLETKPMKVTLAPNPAKDNVRISLENYGGTLTQPQVVIYNIESVEVFRSSMAPEEVLTVDLSRFISGVYITKIIDGDVVLSTKRLIVQ